MPKLSLTDLVDVVSKSGTPKATKVAQIKNRPPYSPALDFYKPLRDEIAHIHASGGNRASLTHFLSTVTDPKKKSNYPDVVTSYSKWWGKKSITWFIPPSDGYSFNGVDVSVNPELGLIFNSQRYLIKLYFKADSLSKARIDLVTHMMEIALRPQCKNSEIMAVLDLRNSKLFTPTVPIPALTAVVNAELAYIAALWPSV
ncbi:MAG: hypothetical protein P4L11_05155 [Geothrix sp.]|nr:hypothetical protein [Geothrix sp.]